MVRLYLLISEKEFTGEQNDQMRAEKISFQNNEVLVDIIYNFYDTFYINSLIY